MSKVQMTLGEALQRGLEAHHAGNLQDAEQFYRAVLAAQPNHPDALHLLGVIANQVKNYEASVDLIEKAIAALSTSSVFHQNIISPLIELGRLDQASEHGRMAVKLDPDNVEARYNYGNVLRKLGRVDEAIAQYREVYERAPDHLLSRWNATLLSLLSGKFEDGWDGYEQRWQAQKEMQQERDFPQPLWDGSDLGSETLLLWSEQGVGDEILFASMYNDLCARGISAVVECDVRFLPLFSRSFPTMMFVPRGDPPVSQTSSPNITAQLPTGGLGKFFRRSNDDFPATSAYLKADPNRRNSLRARYQGRGEGAVVGVAWRGGSAKHGQMRELGLPDLASVLKGRGYTLINLQYGDVTANLEEAKALGLDIFNDPDVDQLKSLDDLAAQTAALDFVVSMDNAAVQMAAAQGVPAFIFITQDPDWRWGINRDRTLWYPSARLFRQSTDGSWQDACAKAASALDALG